MNKEEIHRLWNNAVAILCIFAMGVIAGYAWCLYHLKG